MKTKATDEEIKNLEALLKTGAQKVRYGQSEMLIRSQDDIIKLLKQLKGDKHYLQERIITISSVVD